jgi:hypothetical protein
MSMRHVLERKKSFLQCPKSGKVGALLTVLVSFPSLWQYDNLKGREIDFGS